MKVRKFTAKSSRDALRKVREDLGPDAVILANRMVRGGVEILAMPAAEMAAHQAEAAQQRLRAQAAAEPADSWPEADGQATRPRRPAGMADPLLDAMPTDGRSDVGGLGVGGLGDGWLGGGRSGGGRSGAPLGAFAEQSGPRRAVRRQPVEAAATVPAVLRRRAASAGAELLPASPLPPVLRHSGFKPSAPLATVARQDAAPERMPAGYEPMDTQALAGAQAALAEQHDPLMAALASEVRSLGGMLNQVRRANTGDVAEVTTVPQARTATTAGAGLLAGQSTAAGTGLSAAQSMAAGPGVPATPVQIEAREAGVSARAETEGPARTAVPGEDWVRSVMGELRTMRLMIEDQVGAAAFGETARLSPSKGRIARQLSAAGFSSPLIRKLSTRLPEDSSEQDSHAFVRHALVSNLSVAGSEAELLDQGGVFALVGPTGAGKTTTAAKLAARFVVRHGAENMALLTTDGYRIGGQEQLRIYGKILGVAVHAVKDAEDLKRTLAELKNRKLVLIDTVGLSQRDRMVNEQHDLFARCGTPIKRLLVLNATCHGETLNDVVRAYQGEGLSGCIFSKLDEAVTLGAALDTAIRHRLRVFYAADGQRVPEDLHLANAGRLVDVALQRAPGQGGFGTVDLDFPLELPAPSAALLPSAPASASASAGHRGVAHG